MDSEGSLPYKKCLQLVFIVTNVNLLNIWFLVIVQLDAQILFSVFIYL